MCAFTSYGLSAFFKHFYIDVIISIEAESMPDCRVVISVSFGLVEVFVCFFWGGKGSMVGCRGLGRSLHLVSD